MITQVDPVTKPGRFKKFFDGDFFYSFRTSPIAVIASVFLVTFLLLGLFAPWISPTDPTNAASFNLMDSELPPAWTAGGDGRYLLGTDVQGRDLFSLLLYGLRISLLVGFIGMGASVVLGVTLGLLSGYYRGWVDTVIMRTADAMLSFPTIMFALLISGSAKVLLPQDIQGDLAIYIIILSITLTGWMKYARTVRGAVLLEGSKEYVLAAKAMGSSAYRVMFLHILPNVLNAVLVLATLHVALAVLIEATLSFLGVGLPPNQPSLGTLINEGNTYLFAGQWWVILFPALVLVLFALSVNLVGDWLRDALNPKLKK
ncbi:ABC transporter permease [Qingshengfaniella alkalisoli]|uniref:ABC transporter permease n=1 Tax=Qingshengfaniella alkalisoli TaxID=2599296 RepID=A0A5B8I9F6_9RHOB|nr:ABC transporter permease [Qingshengfaniella alkalisoli]QDY70509.1 ABC transporter permease [Qingshengfaniella alkalisoli]